MFSVIKPWSVGSSRNFPCPIKTLRFIPYRSPESELSHFRQRSLMLGGVAWWHAQDTSWSVLPTKAVAGALGSQHSTQYQEHHGSLHVWFWSHLWLLWVQKPCPVSQVFMTPAFCYMTPQRGRKHSVSSSDLIRIMEIWKLSDTNIVFSDENIKRLQKNHDFTWVVCWFFVFFLMMWGIETKDSHILAKHYHWVLLPAP